MKLSAAGPEAEGPLVMVPSLVGIARMTITMTLEDAEAPRQLRKRSASDCELALVLRKA